MDFKLSSEDLHYLATHTDVPRSKLQEFYNQFVEKFSDGKITKETYKNLMRELLGFIDDGKLDSFMFRLFDSNNDGHIDFKEFWMAMYVMTKGTKEQKLKQVFQLYDINNDKKVSQDELTNAMKVMLQVTDYQDSKEVAEYMALDLFIKIDANKDGKVIEQEFVDACLGNEMISKMLADPFQNLLVANANN